MIRRNWEHIVVPWVVLGVGDFNQNNNIIMNITLHTALRKGNLKNKFNFRSPVATTNPSSLAAEWSCLNCEKAFDCLKVREIRILSSTKDIKSSGIQYNNIFKRRQMISSSGLQFNDKWHPWYPAVWYFLQCTIDNHHYDIFNVSRFLV